MRFEDALEKLKAGGCIAQVGHRFPEAYMKLVDGVPHWHNFGLRGDPFKAMQFGWDELCAQWEVVDPAAQDAKAPVRTHTCPRREESWQASREAGVEPLDHYRQTGGETRCSYCGSVSGEAFLAFARAGGELGPTDKGYKVYLHATKLADGSMLQPPGIKFYFQHLDPQQRSEFIALMNARTLKIGYPGHFYTLPYFVGVARPGDAE